MKKQKRVNKTAKKKEAPAIKPYMLAIAMTVTASSIFIAVLYPKKPYSVFAPSDDFISLKSMNISCSNDYHKSTVFPGCTPTLVCGRHVIDGMVTAEEVDILLSIVKRALKHGESDGGASILDLHSGALSKGRKFVNIYKYLDKNELFKIFPVDHLKLFVAVKNRIHKAISEQFGIHPNKLFLTKPTFFSRMTSAPAQTQHDEYWHTHIDKIQYGSFDYTSLLYLSNYKKEFVGGRFIFDDTSGNVTVEPKLGRISFFTSGSENPHHVEKVTKGTRFALTISFSCDPKEAIKDPVLLDMI